ncbi:helix-turn-helix domain-containing protein [Sphingobacterium sp. SGR-19]|jgi:transcriptional regulator with XRE-family HTH domain|uniref:helix-turn-helix domain-containing protein n=1 Tax=Sphingobacterium sp. SGR-19 TaxID=2710886 RepID=UPI0013EAFF20|nr:helix-turn-helix domain-containing protein [Sphingobacterium sp. SGR-19]NGM64997.1 helix-turn-helix transcriptional regulator [Sphingobacterium sp. SGR-19]
MHKKSLFELEIINRSIQIRTYHKKSQSYIAMILDVTDGYIGHIENPLRPEMYTHDQINAIALDLGISPHDFYPHNAVVQDLPKKNAKQYWEKANAIRERLNSLIDTNFFKSEKSVLDIIDKLRKDKDFLYGDLTNKDITDQARPLVNQGQLKSKRISNKNYYYKP